MFIRIGAWVVDGVQIASYSAFDDLAINDTTGAVQNASPGWGGVVMLSPMTGASAHSQLVGSDGNSVDNYALVDEIPPATADYVESGTPDEIDSYVLSNVPAAYDTVVLVQPIVYAALEGAGAGDIRLGILSDATEVYDAADKPLGTSYAFIQGDPIYADPDGPTAWTVAAANLLELCVKVVA
jgi:hypothetical protein